MDVFAAIVVGLLFLLMLAPEAAAVLQAGAMPAVGREAMVGAVAKMVGPVGQGANGLVLVDGELWRATADSEIPKGAQVRVTRVTGLTVHVEPVQ